MEGLLGVLHLGVHQGEHQEVDLKAVALVEVVLPAVLRHQRQEVLQAAVPWEADP